MDREAVEEVIRRHLGRRPVMEATDVYKLLFQGVFGVGHIMGEEAWDRLREEAGRIDLGDHPGEPLIEEVSADGFMVRVNLRPYLRRGLPLDKLYQAMKASGGHRGRREEFIRVWGIFKEMTYREALSFSDFKGFDAAIEREGPRPRHHSQPYREAYYPAYRVVRREALEGLIEAPDTGN